MPFYLLFHIVRFMNISYPKNIANIISFTYVSESSVQCSHVYTIAILTLTNFQPFIMSRPHSNSFS